MNRFTIHPGVIANEAAVVLAIRSTGRYSSGAPRGSQARRLSPGELFERYAEELALGRKNEFLKSLSRDQFDALCASLERSTKS